MTLDKFRQVDVLLNRANDYQLETQFVKEGDYNGRELVVQITNAGEVSNQAGLSLNLGWHHSVIGNRGLDPFTVVDASKGVFKIAYPTEMLFPGDVTASIQIIDGDKITLTRNFKITVEESPIDENAIVSENSFTVLQEMLTTTGQYNTRIGTLETEVDTLNDKIANIGDVDTPVSDIMQEVIDARGTYPVLNSRLNAMDNAIAEGGNSDSVQTSLNQFMVNIADFGAVYDDPTFDNMPIISAAQDYVSTHGGGDIYFPDLGVLYVKPYLKLKKGVRLIGAVSRPIIRVAPDVKDFYMLFGVEYVNNCAFYNLEIDSNFENRTGYDISASPQILIQISDAQYVDIERNTLKGNGVWIFAAFTGGTADYSRFIKFNDNHVIWRGGLSTDKIGSAYGVEVDNTTVYWDAIDYEMRNNFIETLDGLKNMTCIEMHGANAILENNVIYGFRTGLIVWSLIAHTENSKHIIENNLTVIDNKFVNVEAGITNGTSIGIGGGDYNLTNVTLANNKILMAPSKFDRASGRGIEVNLRSKGKNFKIHNNIVESLPNTRSFADPDTIYNFTGLSINGGELTGFDIRGNTFANINGVGLLVQNGADAPVKLVDSIIEDNLFIDCGKGGNITHVSYAPKTAMTIRRNDNNKIIRTRIGVNEIRDSKPTGTYFDRPVIGLTKEDDDQNIITNNRTSWTGRVTVPVKLQIDGGNNEYIRPTTDSTRKVVFDKDEVTISHAIWIDKDYRGDRVYMHLPINAAVEKWNYHDGSWSHYSSETGEVTSGTFLVTPDVTRLAWFAFPNLKGINLKKNDYLWFEFTYNVDMMDKYRL